ncbi:VWA domain-containing protein [Corallococcus sp. H22C18031201]|uniref:vWA domain-containing protein n=1 Tax=Citreicoccus inhibens TaxID=2849499 RepID=UPI000E7085AA|nr:vWA domain-containing protein [Citreicoccus inhibens]MBU8894451.1 VWA domain-containing protein [Citreicoccus inhibens]RJS16613.1 VWA domain-containing protein [Corallococcus sp. H22C18031201]
MSRTGRLLVASLAALAVVVACTDSYLYDPRRETEVPADRAVAFEGRFCTLGANEVRRPIKIVIAMDASQSMRVSDPDGTRATALVDLIENLPQDDEVAIAVMLFAGSTTAFLTQNPGPPPEDGFVQVSKLDAAARNKLTEQLLTFRNQDTSPNRDSTDFVKPLADIYSLINTDISRARQNPDGAQALALARYSVIFLSDGHPTNDQRDELVGGDAVVRIRQLRDLVEDVKVNTVHVFNPTQPVTTRCDVTDTGEVGDGGCPLRIINQDAQLLEDMAGRGGGNFRDFRNNEPINFLNFQFGQVRRAFTLKELVASNFSAPPGSPLGEADTDGDGLSDAREAELGTNPNLKDTDGDGFSDGVEVYYRERGVDFNPTQVALPDGGGLDKGCPPALRAQDTDCDGLLDCDEQFIGTNASLVDSDRDGVPDGVEWRGGTQGSSDDLDEDPDNDGLTSRAELRMHMRPLTADTAHLASDGYRYNVVADGPPDVNGRQCYRFRVDNVLLAPTQDFVSDGGVAGGPDAGVVLRGAGYNDLYLSIAMVPADEPSSRTLVRTFRVDNVRYPVAGIKSPPDGVIRVNPEDFVDGCFGRPTP